MDDFQLRVVRAAERLAGRDGPDFGERLDLLVAGQALLAVRLAQLIAVQQAILAKMPGPP